MAKVLIVYGSTTGNTKWVAEQVSAALKAAGNEVELKDAGGCPPEGLCKGRDLVLFGCSTWGQDEIELQDDFIPLYEAFDKIGADGVKCGVFGCGDEDYTYYCGAVDAISEKLEKLGAKVAPEKLKINGDPDGASADIAAWSGKMAALL